MFTAYIRADGQLRILETIRADHFRECQSMAEKSAERLMLSGDITKGATIDIRSRHDIYPCYYWPQI